MMKSRAFVIWCSAGVLLAVVFVVGANPSPSAAPQWEYGIYTESPGNYEWQDAGRRVHTTNPTQFFERMGFPTGLEVDARTGRVPALALNHLGRQGWELVDTERTEPKRDVYWFKRPR
jgi:hypothetical protein